MDENEDVQQELGDRLVEETKVLARRKYRDGNKENVSFETHGKEAKSTSRHIEETINVLIYFNCHRYVRKYCSDKHSCQHCGGGHGGLECNALKQDCQNYKVIRIPTELR